MAYMIIDTETTSLDRPFCYDIGYNIITETGETLTRAHYVIEQVWHNLPLFESAYYKDKRPIYIQLMRQHKAIMTKYGYAMQAIKRDIEKYNVIAAYAYNSQFDDKVITFNCDWFKCLNPFDNIPIYDIWGYASQYITTTQQYKDYCEQHQFFTDTGNYKSSAEIVYRYITNDTEFIEAHMGLYDTDIEAKILLHCITLGAEWNKDYKVIKILTRPVAKPFVIKINNQILYKGNYIKKYARNDIYNFTEG